MYGKELLRLLMAVYGTSSVYVDGMSGGGYQWWSTPCSHILVCVHFPNLNMEGTRPVCNGDNKYQLSSTTTISSS